MRSHPTTPPSLRRNPLRKRGVRALQVATWISATATAALTSLSSTPALAAGACSAPDGLSTCVDADNLWAEPGRGPFFALGPAETTPEGRVSFGLVVSYLSRPIGYRTSSPD